VLDRKSLDLQSEIVCGCAKYLMSKYMWCGSSICGINLMIRCNSHSYVVWIKYMWCGILEGPTVFELKSSHEFKSLVAKLSYFFWFLLIVFTGSVWLRKILK
jgi:hypothetical protein